MRSDGDGVSSCHRPLCIRLITCLLFFSYGRRHDYPPQTQVSLLVLRSVITHLIVPGGLCKIAVPDGGELPADRLINTRRSPVLCSILKVFPVFVAVPRPVNVVVPQHHR